MPNDAKFSNEGAGSTQRVDLPNGEILLPTYCVVPGSAKGVFDRLEVSTGRPIHRANGGRGFSEPSVVVFQGRYYLALRNNDYGAVTSGADGRRFDEPKLWTFDDGSDLGNYNTQQHWVNMPNALYLVYNRRGANNDHVCRHRAPLFIAQVDTDRLCVIRDTEQILVPERGARLGNFGVVQISENESWVTVAEWMQTIAPDPWI